jgi:transcription initiation factor IIF auxiliary subunit
MLVEEDAYLGVWDGSFDLTVRDADRHTVYSKRHTSEHRFEFRAEREGSHEFCFMNNKHYPQLLYYHAHVGHHWAHDAATKDNLNELQRSLASLTQIAGQVDEEVRYQKVRETAQRKTSETINGRVLGYSALEAAALVLTALFQAQFVKRLFESKSVGRASGV